LQYNKNNKKSVLINWSRYGGMDMPVKIPKTIRISEHTAKRLMKIGKFGETFDDVIVRLLDELEIKENKE
jgi:hypothetical protein